MVALSDANSEIVERYSYDIFGEPTIYDADGNEISDSNYSNPYMFTGRRFDPEADLYYYRARYYAYNIGRFLQTDPVGYENSMNLYTYCGNNPINFIDPYGEVPQFLSRWGHMIKRGASRSWQDTKRAARWTGRQAWRGAKWTGRQIGKGTCWALNSTPAGRKARCYLDTCEKGNGKFLGENISLSGVLGLGAAGGVQGGGQALVLCDQRKVCFYGYGGIGPGAGVGASVSLNVGRLGGSNVFKPSDYTGFFGNAELAVGSLIGAYGGGFAAPAKGNQSSWASPHGWEAGASIGGGASATLIFYGQYYGKIGCCDVK